MKRFFLLLLFAALLYRFAGAGPDRSASTPVYSPAPFAADSTGPCSLSQKAYRYPDSIYAGSKQRAVVSRKDSLLHVRGGIRSDYRVIGYRCPDNRSERLILFSVFTRDVQDNPYQCAFGAFYSSDADGMAGRRSAIPGRQSNSSARICFSMAPQKQHSISKRTGSGSRKTDAINTNSSGRKQIVLFSL